MAKHCDEYTCEWHKTMQQVTRAQNDINKNAEEEQQQQQQQRQALFRAFGHNVAMACAIQSQLGEGARVEAAAAAGALDMQLLLFQTAPPPPPSTRAMESLWTWLAWNLSL